MVRPKKPETVQAELDASAKECNRLRIELKDALLKIESNQESGTHDQKAIDEANKLRKELSDAVEINKKQGSLLNDLAKKHGNSTKPNDGQGKPFDILDF